MPSGGYAESARLGAGHFRACGAPGLLAERADDEMVPMEDFAPRRLPEPMSEEELEDFLTEAIGFYAEHTKTPLTSVRTFEEARLLFKNRGLVLAIGASEFRLSITRC